MRRRYRLVVKGKAWQLLEELKYRGFEHVLGPSKRLNGECFLLFAESSDELEIYRWFADDRVCAKLLWFREEGT